MNIKITAKQFVSERRENSAFSKLAKIKIWIKYLAEKGWLIFTKSFWDAVLEKYGPKQ